jgi:hypothetical protein
MQRRIEIAALLILVIILAVVYFHRDEGAGIPGVLASNVQFTPLDVQEPQLRLDLLDKIKKSAYTGTHRNIFIFGPAPPPALTPAEKREEARARIVGPVRTPPPPLNIPVQFFGTASMPDSGKHIAFFQSGEDVMIVPEGDTFLNLYRLVHIGPESVEVEEISSGRRGTVPMVPPADQASSQQMAGQPQEDQ